MLTSSPDLVIDMQIIDCEQGTPEWRAARSGIATASRFADVMAKIKTGEAAGRRNYRADLVVEILTGKPLDYFTTAAMKQGTEREPFARMAYESQTGIIVDEVGFCKHDTLDAGASPDGLIGIDGGIEIKCPERSAHLQYLQLAAEPTEYTWQIQGCMWITGRSWWEFASYNPDFPDGLKLSVRRVMRDQSKIESLQLEVENFMREVKEEVSKLISIVQSQRMEVK